MNWLGLLYWKSPIFSFAWGPSFLLRRPLCFYPAHRTVIGSWVVLWLLYCYLWFKPALVMPISPGVWLFIAQIWSSWLSYILAFSKRWTICISPADKVVKWKRNASRAEIQKILSIANYRTFLTPVRDCYWMYPLYTLEPKRFQMIVVFYNFVCLKYVQFKPYLCLWLPILSHLSLWGVLGYTSTNVLWQSRVGHP